MDGWIRDLDRFERLEGSSIHGWIRDLDSNGEASGTIDRNLEVDQEDPT